MSSAASRLSDSLDFIPWIIAGRAHVSEVTFVTNCHVTLTEGYIGAYSGRLMAYPRDRRSSPIKQARWTQVVEPIAVSILKEGERVPHREPDRNW